MHQITGDPKYREWGWTIFQSFEKHLKTTYGYGSLRDVRRPQGGMMVSADPALPRCFLSLFKHQNALLRWYRLWSQDRMESFWLAETLKYTYMLQDDEASIDLEKFVLNTEAHPFPIADKLPVLTDLT